MPEPKYLWRVSVRYISTPIYLVAQNMASAHAHATNHPLVDPADATMLHRIGPWDEAQNMTIVTWPEPPPEPQPPLPPLP